MKFNSKILSVLLVLLAVLMVISAASAVDLVNDIGIEVPSESNFDETANVNMNNVNFVIFENSASNANDVASIIYFKDSEADKNSLNDFIKDLEDDGEKIEETDKYSVFKTTQNSNDFDVPTGFDNVLNFAEDLFSQGNGFNFSADGNSVSFSDEGLKISDASGENVSISSEGINVSGDSSSDSENVDISSEVGQDIEKLDYYIFLKNTNGNEVVVIFGNDLDSLKSMAETASFNEN